MDVTLKLSRRDPSTSLGMTCFCYGAGACIVSTATIPASNASNAIAAAINKAVRPGSRCLLRVRNGEALAKSAGRMLVVATFASTFAAAGSGWVALIGMSASKRASTAPKRMRSPECNVISPVSNQDRATDKPFRQHVIPRAGPRQKDHRCESYCLGRGQP